MFHIEVLLAELLFFESLKPRLKRYQIAIMMSIYCLLPYLFPNTFFWTGVRLGNWFTFGFLIMLVLLVALMAIAFEISDIKKLLFFSIAAILIQHLAHSISEAVYLIFGIEPVISLSLVVIHTIIVILVYGLSYLIFARRLISEDVSGVRNGPLMLFMAFAIFIVFFLSLWTTMVETPTVGLFLFDSFSCTLLLLLLFGTFEQSKLEQQHAVLQQILHHQKKQHADSVENIELIHMKFHDLKYQIAALRRASDLSEHVDSLREIEMGLNVYDMSVKTGNATLDVLLAETSPIWDKYGVNFSCIADGSKLDFMSPPDVYSLFGNALDNALESVKNIANKDKRIISLHIASKGNYVVINLSNYFEHEIVFEDGLPVTSSSNKDYHGYGVKSIKYLTKKYDGTFSILVEDNIFKLSILIPIQNPEPLTTHKSAG